MEILEQIDELVQSVENRMRQLADEKESLRKTLEAERGTTGKNQPGWNRSFRCFCLA